MINSIYTIPQFIFAFFNAFSGQTIYDDFFIMLYNMGFTALPVAARAVFDQDVSYKVNKKPKNEQEKQLHRSLEKRVQQELPNYYYLGQKKVIFNRTNFLGWCFQGGIHACILYFTVYGSFSKHIFYEKGYSSGLWSYSIMLYTSVILVETRKPQARSGPPIYSILGQPRARLNTHTHSLSLPLLC